MRLAFVVSLVAILSACSGGSPKSESAPGNGGPATEETAKETDPSDETTGAAMPEPSAVAGQVLLDVTGVEDPASVRGYVVKNQDLEIQSTADGKLFIDNVPPGSIDIVITTGTVAIAALTGVTDNRGRRLNDVVVKKNERTNPGKFDLPIAGSITGNAKRFGQTDHLGIEVFIPGTSYQAKTDAAGNYKIDNVPVGTHDLAFSYQSYFTGRLQNVEVISATNTVASDIVLAISTGADGVVVINGGAAVSGSRTVGVIIAASENALQMKISHDANFSGVPYIPVKTSTSYTFPNDGQPTLYVKLADENGLENVISSSIQIDTTPPTGVIDNNDGLSGKNNKSALNVSISGTDDSPIYYKYKVGVASTTNCAVASGYSAAVLGTTPITSGLTSFPDVELKLCINPGDSLGNFQPLSEAIERTWEKDLTAPTVDSTSVTTGMSVVGSDFTVTFSEEIAAGTFNTPGRFTVIRDEDDVSISGTSSGNATSAAFQPLQPLAGATSYTVKLSADVKDPSGNALSAYEFQVTTGPGWQHHKLLTSDEAYGAQVAMLAGGDAVGVWTQEIAGTKCIFASTFDGQTKTWTTPEQLADACSDQPSKFKLTSNGNDKALLIWASTNVGNNAKIYGRRFDATVPEWVATETLDARDGALVYKKLDAAMSANGNAVVLWSSYDAATSREHVSGRIFKTSAWSPALGVDPQTIMSGSANGDQFFSLQGAINDDARAVTAFIRYPGRKIHMNAYDGTAWGAAGEVDSASATVAENNDGDVAIALPTGTSAKATIMWLSSGASNDIRMRHYQFGTGFVGNTTTAFSAQPEGNQLRSGIDSSGNIIMVWAAGSLSDTRIYASRFNGTAWSAASQISQSAGPDCIAPELAVNASGQALAVWSTQSTSTTFRANRFNGTSWETAYQIESVSTHVADSAGVGIDSAGRGIVISTKQLQDGGARKTWYNLFAVP